MNSAMAQKLNMLLELASGGGHLASIRQYVGNLGMEERADLVALSREQHVLIRALGRLRDDAAEHGNAEMEQWAGEAVRAEAAAVSEVLPVISEMRSALAAVGITLVVMKSLDHWPDFGNDIDLYADGDPQRALQVLGERFHPQIDSRSYGDVLASKWRLLIPGVKKEIELHTERLGQMGEHRQIGERMVRRRRPKCVQGLVLDVPAAEEQVLAVTIERMYRHFFIRVCDIVNLQGLIEREELDYEELGWIARYEGLWAGTATLLRIVAEMATRASGRQVEIPVAVRQDALFGSEEVFLKGRYFRVPIFPGGARLLCREMGGKLRRWDVAAAARLSLFPPLASAAKLHYKLTGCTRGIW
jgi:hypothetical protein